MVTLNDISSKRLAVIAIKLRKVRLLTIIGKDRLLVADARVQVS